ncbi:hypothetical protein EMWEY_00059250 [Eimeria maxima]|uniref:Uncharacterized protein n=1 Tax=Eimeria maxima TaxID=5804 RepID=U6MDV7_EIMMA|nr:hypothetical protein EMWEY_00059250 [Eimeria maxima]CDJ59860.1 hypothetical protein EMWEY_00059250 [Eimeria maxima]
MVRSDTELALEPEETDSQYGMRRVSKKHLVVLFVVFLILLKIISVKRERSKQAREKLKQAEAAGEEVHLPEGGVFLPEGEPQEALPPKQPAEKEVLPKQTPPSGVVGVPQVQPTAKTAKVEQREGIPGRGAVTITERDAELQELRAECSAISRLFYVVSHLVNELPRQEAKEYADALISNVNTAEKAYKEYGDAKGRGDPNTTQIRTQTVNVMNQSLQVAKDSLLHLATLAKTHGEAVEAYCSQGIHFTDTWNLRTPLSGSLGASPSVKVCLETLKSVEGTVWTLQQENKEVVGRLKHAELIDMSDISGFADIYGIVAALNFRQYTLERLAALDSAVRQDILEMHKAIMLSKLQKERIPLEIDADLVIGIHVLLSATRPSYGWQPASGISNEEIEDVKILFSQQYQEVEAMKSAQDVEGVTAAYERANSYNQKLQYMLPVLKERLHAVLQSQPLTKEEAAAASKKMEGIANAAIEDSEQLWEVCQTAYEYVGGNPEEVALGVGVGKALLQKLTTMTKSSTDEQEEDVTRYDSGIVGTVRKYFTVPTTQIENYARDFWVKAQEILESTRKGKKYKLDKQEFGSSALDKKIAERVDVATKKGLVVVLRLRFRYLSRIAAEIAELERLVDTIPALPFRSATDEWNNLQRQFSQEKANASNANDPQMIPACVDRMLQIYLRMQTLVLNDRLQLLNEPVDYPATDPYSADL